MGWFGLTDLVSGRQITVLLVIDKPVRVPLLNSRRSFFVRSLSALDISAYPGTKRVCHKHVCRNVCICFTFFESIIFYSRYPLGVCLNTIFCYGVTQIFHTCATEPALLAVNATEFRAGRVGLSVHQGHAVGRHRTDAKAPGALHGISQRAATTAGDEGRQPRVDDLLARKTPQPVGQRLGEIFQRGDRKSVV